MTIISTRKKEKVLTSAPLRAYIIPAALRQKPHEVSLELRERAQPGLALQWVRLFHFFLRAAVREDVPLRARDHAPAGFGVGVDVDDLQHVHVLVLGHVFGDALARVGDDLVRQRELVQQLPEPRGEGGVFDLDVPRHVGERERAYFELHRAGSIALGAEMKGGVEEFSRFIVEGKAE